jgi:hypothetical protein
MHGKHLLSHLYQYSIAQVGGRVDIVKEINEITFTASLTDSTVRGYESAPYLPDAIVTADKRINS